MAVRFVQLPPASLSTGTATVVGSTAIQCSSIFIQADALNTGNIYWGDSTVSASAGFSLAAGEKASITLDSVPGNSTYLTLGSIYLTTDTTGNVARLAYWRVN